MKSNALRIIASRASSLACLGFVAGCYHTTVVNGHKLLEDAWHETESTVRTQAAFTMQCDEAKVQLTVLETQGFAHATRIGANGCDKRLLYVRQRDGSYVANTATDTR